MSDMTRNEGKPAKTLEIREPERVIMKNIRGQTFI